MSSYPRSHETICQFVGTRPTIWWVKYDKKIHGKLKMKVRSRSNSPESVHEKDSSIELEHVNTFQGLDLLQVPEDSKCILNRIESRRDWILDLERDLELSQLSN